MTQISGLLRKPINLRPSDRVAVEDALSLVNGRAAAFAVTTLSGVLDAARRATDRLDARGVRRADRVGAVATYVPAGPSAKSYQHEAVSTAVTIRLGADGKTWRLVGVARSVVQPRSPFWLTVSLTTAGLAGYLDCRRGDFGLHLSREEADREHALAEQRRVDAARAAAKEQEAARLAEADPALAAFAA